jgi:hypothetical protein
MYGRFWVFTEDLSMNSCNTPRMRTSNSWSNWFLEHWAMATVGV